MNSAYLIVIGAVVFVGCSHGTDGLNRSQALYMLRHSPMLESVVVDGVTGIESNGDGAGHTVVDFTFHSTATGAHTGQALLQRSDDGWQVGDVATR